MGLSDELISQFVKNTKDDNKTNDEVTAYGKISVSGEGNNRKIQVTLDGSYTPMDLDIKQLTVSVSNGDRVRLSIKNHSLCVTGNLTDHSASSETVNNTNARIDCFDILVADKVSTEELAVERARIDVLSADYADISGRLSANEADIVDLKATDAEITGTLTANTADISKLKADKLDANTAILTYATIKDLDAAEADIYSLNAAYGDFVQATADNFTAVNAKIDKLDGDYITAEELDAVHADITELEANVADIDTLIFGSASGEVIHSSFSNAVIAQLGNAQIKSAMIESVSADKITAGDIITNNVRVLSKDGRLIISDETIQISDSSRVRVQIGKDASNDYSINVWDAAGNLMFSKGGITDSAIKSAIIRNDMVSDTANISAHKLNIDSLFEEINGSAKTIKSTKIYLDDEKQTLDVAFKTLTTETTELGETVSSQGTQIAVVQGQIASKVWQQDINTATNELSTKYSEIEQDVNGITTTVADHTSQISENMVTTSSLISQLSNSIASLVTDGNGTSLMTQTDNGWTFSTAEIQKSVNNISENLGTLADDVNDVDNTIGILQQAIDDLGEIADYVRVTSFQNEPCIELGEGDSDFKLRITNTKMVFTEGSETLAYFTNQAFNSKKVVVEEELQQGQFVWKVRANGNLGLMWIGGNG